MAKKDTSETEIVELTVKMPSRLAAHLGEVCKDHELTHDEAVEEALKTYLREHARRARLTAFGLWKNHKRKGVDVQAALRAKW